jgi:opacity protein-like surface antigen
MQGVFSVLLLATTGSHLQADEFFHGQHVCGQVACGQQGCCLQDCCGPQGRGAYVSIFGGVGSFNTNNVTQVGTALIPDNLGGPLGVSAGGTGDTKAFGLGGLSIGYEGEGWWLGDGDWALLPAVEIEGMYLGGTQSATVSAVNRLNGHVFETTFPMNNGAFLANAVFSLQTPCPRLKPYLGAGLGTAIITVSGADSLQVVPPEPGINHFNSHPDGSCWAFAAQTKLGVRFHLTDNLYVFTEYRFLYVSSTNFTFGSTVYPTHVPTTPWTVHFGDLFHHAAVGGIGVSF